MMATAQHAFSSPPPQAFSSSPLPSPGTVIRQFCGTKKSARASVVYEIPDSQDDEPELGKPPVKSKTKQKSTASVTKKARGPALKAKTTNKTVRDTIKSKYFADPGGLEKEETEKPKRTRKPAARKKTVTATATDSVAPDAPPKAKRKKAEPKGKAKVVIPNSPSPGPAEAASSPVRRRRSRTPPFDSVVDSFSIEKKEGSEEALSFSEMIGALAYKSTSPEGSMQVSTIATENGGALTRKRRIELVDFSVKPKAAPKTKKPKQPRQPKKKAVTLTERVSARYRKDFQPPSSQVKSYFPTSKTPRSKSTKAKNCLKPITTKRKRADEPEAASLLSPTSAKQRIDSQGFVFGTCSQLEMDQIGPDCEYLSSPFREGSADTIRDIPPFDPAIVGAIYGKGLWDAAKRDKAGKLMRNEDLDFRDTKSPSNATPSPPPPAADEVTKVDHRPEHTRPVALSQQKRVTIDLTLSSPVPEPGTECSPSQALSPMLPRSFLPSSPPQAILSRRSLSPAHSLPSSPKLDTLSDGNGCSVAESTLEPVIPPSLQSPVRIQTRKFSASASPTAAARVTATKTTVAKTAAAKTAAAKAVATKKPRKKASPPSPKSSSKHPGMPDFNSYLTTRLQSELTKYGFKKTGGRAAMVSCMEKCWLAQNPSAKSPEEQEQENESPPSSRARTRTPSPAKRARARSTSAKPRARASSKGPNAGKSAHGKKKRERSSGEMEQLFGKITEAVKTDGKMGDISSFYFRILMYDPIISEEFMTWLNEEGLGSVGTEEKVSAADVRAWCDANGVCLVSEMTQGGSERKRS